MTAPVLGSWGLPAWIASVPKLATGEGARGGVSIEPLIELLIAVGDILRGGEGDLCSWVARAKRTLQKDKKTRVESSRIRSSARKCIAL